MFNIRPLTAYLVAILVILVATYFKTPTSLVINGETWYHHHIAGSMVITFAIDLALIAGLFFGIRGYIRQRRRDWMLFNLHDMGAKEVIRVAREVGITEDDVLPSRIFRLFGARALTSFLDSYVHIRAEAIIGKDDRSRFYVAIARAIIEGTRWHQFKRWYIKGYIGGRHYELIEEMELAFKFARNEIRNERKDRRDRARRELALASCQSDKVSSRPSVC